MNFFKWYIKGLVDNGYIILPVAGFILTFLASIVLGILISGWFFLGLLLMPILWIPLIYYLGNS